MKNLGKILTIIPAKAASKRLKKKNVALLNGKPLIQYTIETAKASGLCGHIMVSTEDSAIASLARSLGAEVPFMRPEHLAHDPYEVDDVCLYVLDGYKKIGKEFDTLIILLPTSPFCSVLDIESCVRIFKQDDGKFLMSVSQIDPHYYNAMRFGEDKLTMTHIFKDRKNEAKKGYATRCNGAVMIVDVKAFQETGTYYGEPLIGYEMPWERSIDVDTHRDLIFAEWLMDKNAKS